MRTENQHNSIIVDTVRGFAHLIQIKGSFETEHKRYDLTSDLHDNHLLEMNIAENGGVASVHFEDGTTRYASVAYTEHYGWYVSWRDENLSPCGGFDSLWMGMHLTDTDVDGEH